MDKQEFDNRLSKLFTNMVEVAYEFVDNNKTEVDDVYIFCSIEEGEYFFNVFYKINGNMVEMHKVDTVSKKQYDVSSKRMFAVLDFGGDYLQEIAALFKGDDQPVPTMMKMVYNPKTGSFDNDISYDLQYTNSAGKTSADVFETWYAELGGKLS